MLPVVAVDHDGEWPPEQVALVEEASSKGIPVAPLPDLIRQRCRFVLLDHRVQTTPTPSRWTAFWRRFFDIVCGLIGCLIAAFLAPLVTIAILMEDGWPVFLTQERVGRGGKVFRLIKFRSMLRDAELLGPQWATSHDPRFTRVGSFLRRFRLDEVPQFINVLVGQMSMLGPRPERPFFVTLLKQHIPGYDMRHTVRPGITGWGTVRVGYGNSIEAKYLTHQFDLYYINNRNVLFDLEILLRSMLMILSPVDRRNKYML
jgi:lipopolysaccharide/colanic/teichoic acid biosynthesis glycosyltransferase